VPRSLRVALLVVLVLIAAPVATVRAAARMPVGFYDDPSFRWAQEKVIPTNLAAAEKANASIVHVLADWSQIAPTKPKNPLNGNDPAYNLSDLDALVRTAPRYNLSLLITISQTPKWANGGQTPNHPPTNLNNLTQFAQMLATRYNGRTAGFAAVRRWSVWNEPNLQQFLTPTYNAAGKPASPKEYVKIFLAAYKGIKHGNPNAMIAAGETSNRGHQAPSPGSDSLAPATFAHDVALADPKLPLAAWAEHPYPSNIPPSPTQKVAYPNIALTNIDRFGADLQTWFHKFVPVWVTEWAEQTKPQNAFGVSYAQQAKDAKTALSLAAASKYTQMFIWFIFRDSDPSCTGTWCSGVETTTGKKKPSYNAFAAAAKPLYGYTQVVNPGHPFNINIDVPYMTYHDSPGTVVGVTYRVYQLNGKTVEAIGQPRAVIARDQTITFKVNFKPQKTMTYLLTANVNDKHGQTETIRVQLIPPLTTAAAPKAPPPKKK
jgi:Glycosyl hydrolases family 39